VSIPSPLDKVWADLAANPSGHAPGTQAFESWATRAAEAFETSRRRRSGVDYYATEAFGDLAVAAFQMGAVSSVDIFASLNELIIFSFYVANRGRYRHAADLGANIGLHALMMARLGWRVSAYEPDPAHLAQLRANLALNGVSDVEVHPAAVSDRAGAAAFVRVLGNTTSSHLQGSKSGACGELETLQVPVVDVRPVLAGRDFVKVDVEGHEARLIEALGAHDFTDMDMMVELGTEAIADRVFSHLTRIGVGAFPQKIGWRRASAADELPRHYSEGSLFVSRRAAMPWSAE
jgi:FkbM family methyltransferase